MDAVHELSRADRMAQDLADILERLIALERKIDAVSGALGSMAVKGASRPRQCGRSKKIGKKIRKKKTGV